MTSRVLHHVFIIPHPAPFPLREAFRFADSRLPPGLRPADPDTADTSNHNIHRSTYHDTQQETQQHTKKENNTQKKIKKRLNTKHSHQDINTTPSKGHHVSHFNDAIPYPSLTPP